MDDLSIKYLYMIDMQKQIEMKNKNKIVFEKGIIIKFCILQKKE